MAEGDRIVLAIDGGGTKTECWIARSSRAKSASYSRLPRFEWEILGKGRAGPGNPRSVGFEQAMVELERAIEQAKVECGLSHDHMDGACLALAGAGREAERAAVTSWAQHRRLARVINVTDDIEPLRFAAAMEQQQRQQAHDSPDLWILGAIASAWSWELDRSRQA